MKKLLIRIFDGPLEPLFYISYHFFTNMEYRIINIIWWLQGYRKPDKKEITKVVDNVTFIYKSFERQNMAKKLYKNIQSFYPGAKVVIADDSLHPLKIKDKHHSLQIIQLPFNSGLSVGLNKALEEVNTPFVMRMDDDELLTLKSCVDKEIDFLKQHPEIDLVGFGVLSAPKCISPEKSSVLYYRQTMKQAPKKLKIPHLTPIDDHHVVVGKSPNIFLVHTNKLKEIGWDNNIRMIDHNDFFMRAAGKIVSVINPLSAVFHYHNHFDSHYKKYRMDIFQDRIYIMSKYLKK